jgi:hypothetical protein
LINAEPSKERKEKKKGGTSESKGFYLLRSYLYYPHIYMYVLADSFNFGHFHACMHECVLLVLRCRDLPPTVQGWLQKHTIDRSMHR